MVIEVCFLEGMNICVWIDMDEDGNLDGEILVEDILGIFFIYRIMGDFLMGEYFFLI